MRYADLIIEFANSKTSLQMMMGCKPVFESIDLRNMQDKGQPSNIFGIC